MNYMLKPLSYVLIIVLGYLLKRSGFLRAEDRTAFSRVMMNITLPCAFIQAFDGLVLEANMFLIIALGLLCAGLPIAFMYLTTSGVDKRLQHRLLFRAASVRVLWQRGRGERVPV